MFPGWPLRGAAAAAAVVVTLYAYLSAPSVVQLAEQPVAE